MTKKSHGGKTYVGVWLTDEEIAALRKYADKKDWDLTQAIRKALRRLLGMPS